MEKSFVKQITKTTSWEYHEPLYPFDSSKVKYVKLIAFHEEEEILVIRNVRSYDIPGGPIEWDDEDVYAAVRRIALEDTNVELEQLTISTIIEIHQEETPDDVTYMLALTGNVKLTKAYPSFQKIRRRAYLKKEKFLEQCEAPSRQALKKLIDMAEFALINNESQNEKISRKKSVG